MTIICSAMRMLENSRMNFSGTLMPSLNRLNKLYDQDDVHEKIRDGFLCLVNSHICTLESFVMSSVVKFCVLLEHLYRRQYIYIELYSKKRLITYSFDEIISIK